MAGFTFLEVMVSLSLIALLFSMLFKMQSQTIELATSSKFNIVAPALCQQLIADMEHDLYNWTKPQGDFGPDFPNIHWTTEISESDFEEIDFINDTLKNRFKKIQITISDQSKKNSYSLSTWRMARE